MCLVLHLYVSSDRIYISYCGFAKNVRALAGTNMTTYRIELRVEFLSVFFHFCILLSIFLPVRRTIGYSVYACLCHKYAEQEKGENGIPFEKEREPNGSAKSTDRREATSKKRIRTAKYHTNILNTLNQREFILSGRPKHMTHKYFGIHFAAAFVAFLFATLRVRNIVLFAYWNWKSTTNICELKN